ncbi:hypothetical protein BC628DRAFT_171158 [Trametes gibbosa]|nr:hypothetical protein BC628DRAFT_171158 [Trametes gibbosa]
MTRADRAGIARRMMVMHQEASGSAAVALRAVARRLCWQRSPRVVTPDLHASRTVAPYPESRALSGLGGRPSQVRGRARGSSPSRDASPLQRTPPSPDDYDFFPDKVNQNCAPTHVSFADKSAPEMGHLHRILGQIGRGWEPAARVPCLRWVRFSSLSSSQRRSRKNKSSAGAQSGSEDGR